MSKFDFLNDEHYMDLIEMCFMRHGSYGMNTFISDIKIVDHVQKSCGLNEMMTSRLEIIPKTMGDEISFDSLFCIEDGEDGDYDEG